MACLTQLVMQVRKSDQEMINEFGKLNNMVLENRADQGQIKVIMCVFCGGMMVWTIRCLYLPG